MLTMSVFWSASLPLVEAITLGHLGDGSEGYGRIRLWGSIGFIVAVIALGYVLDYAPVRALLWLSWDWKWGCCYSRAAFPSRLSCRTLPTICRCGTLCVARKWPRCWQPAF